MLEIRPTLPEDIGEVFPPPLPWRVQAMTGVIDGKVAGVAGVTFLPDGTVAAFMSASEAARAHPMALHRAAVRFLKSVPGKSRIVAMADLNIEAAERWLVRLGFQRVPGEEPLYVLERL